MSDDFNKRQHARRVATCKHFNGVQNRVCALGIEYASVEATAPHGTGRHLPCLPNYKSGECEGACARRELPTEAEVEAEEAAFKKAIGNTMTARAAIVDRIGPWKRGDGGDSGFLPCPICKTGTLHFSRAGSNGHIHAACTTADCVRWME